MRYRALDPNGDYRFGRGQTDFLVNSPEAVAQAVKTRLLLEQGEWFLDTQEGTPYQTRILGKDGWREADWAIRERILATQGVTEIVDYSSRLNPGTRTLTVQVTLKTLHGSATLQQVL